MIIRSAALCSAMVLGGPVWGDALWEVDRFDLTGNLPDIFDPEDGLKRDDPDGWTFVSEDRKAQLIVFGQPNPHDLETARELTRQSLHELEASILFEEQSVDGFVFSGIDSKGIAYLRYTQMGQTCEGDPVSGIFVLRFAWDHWDNYVPVIEDLVESFHIGACG